MRIELWRTETLLMYDVDGFCTNNSRGKRDIFSAADLTAKSNRIPTSQIPCGRKKPQSQLAREDLTCPCLCLLHLQGGGVIQTLKTCTFAEVRTLQSF